MVKFRKDRHHSQIRQQVDKNSAQYELRPDARWRDYEAHQKLSAVLFDLVAKANARARSIEHHIDNQNPKKAAIVASKWASIFAQLNELLALGTLTVSLEYSEGEEILAATQKWR